MEAADLIATQVLLYPFSRTAVCICQAPYDGKMIPPGVNSFSYWCVSDLSNVYIVRLNEYFLVKYLADVRIECA